MGSVRGPQKFKDFYRQMRRNKARTRTRSSESFDDESSPTRRERDVKNAVGIIKIGKCLVLS